MQYVKRHVRTLHRVAPVTNDHLAASGWPSVWPHHLLLLAAGRTDLIIYAVFGA
ncbi:protein involved in response to aluminum ion [Arthrobacter sp. Hiyo6]|nr:protein involved in response to aluminum ion [Arthrobacter sp. Hiyo6]